MYLQITAIGRLGKAPNLNYGPSGAAYTRFSLAVNRRWTGKDGTRQEETTWLRCTAFNSQAETIAEHADKGDLIFVQGRLAPDEHGNPRQWGEPPRASFDVVVEAVRLLGSSADSGDRIADPAIPDDLDF